MMEEFAEPIADATVTACPVDHSIETYAYKNEMDRGTVIYSADTGDSSRLVEFESDADVLTQNCGLGHECEDGTGADRGSWRQ